MSRRQEVIAEFCKIAKEAHDVLDCDGQLAHDCFCCSQTTMSEVHFQFSDAVIEFVRAAVREKIARKRAGKCQNLSELI